MGNKKRGLSAAKLIGSTLAAGARLLTFLFGPYYGARIAAHAASRLAPVIRVRTPRGVVRYPCASANAVKHAWRMIDREPDTIDWIEEYLKPGDHLWDVGANIGVYSVYACLREGVTATAFEPVAGNFHILMQAVVLNGLAKRITPLAMGLSDRTGLATIYLLETEPGTGLHALDHPENVRGSFVPEAALTVPVIRGEDAVRQFGITAPVHVKIDVDGHEMRVLEGLRGLLPGVSTVWIEMAAEAQSGNAQIERFFQALGFTQATLCSGRKGENRLFVNRSRRV